MQFSQNQIVQALCRTLVHSLWQGLLLAVVAGLVVICTKKMRASVRYNILSALLGLFVTGVVVTAYYQFAAIGSKTALTTITQQGFASPNIVYVDAATPIQPAAETSTGSAIINWFNANAGIIVTAWLLIIAFRCLQMLMGLRGIYTLRRKGLTDVGLEWTHRLTELAKSINVTSQIKMVQSAIAKVPMVIGHFKPIILIPAGVLTSLPQDEIEAILLHELAHIRRKDYLVNMLQNICEIIFFFNPAALWVSSLIKDERENCCDDIAIDAVKNKKQFIHALISFQEYNMAASSYAIGFPGKRNHLLNRVKRIVTNNNKSLNNMEKSLLATGIVLISFVLVAFSQIKKPPALNHDNKMQASAQQAQDNTTTNDNSATEDTTKPAANAVTTDDGDYTDTTKKKQTIIDNGDVMFNHFESNDDNGHWTIKTEYNGKDYKFVGDEDDMSELYVDGEKIPTEKWGDYQDIIDRVKQVRKQQKAFRADQERFRQQQDEFREQQNQFRHQQEQMREDQTRMREQQDSLRQVTFGKQRQDQEKLRELQEEMRRTQDSARQQQFGKEREVEEKMRELQRQMRERQDTLMQRDYRNQQEQYRRQQDDFRRQQDEFRRQQDDFRRQQDEFRRDQGRSLQDSGRRHYSYYDGPPPAAPRAPKGPGAPAAAPSVSSQPSVAPAPPPPPAPAPAPPTAPIQGDAFGLNDSQNGNINLLLAQLNKNNNANLKLANTRINTDNFSGDKLINKIVNDLKKDNTINNDSRLSFTLNNKQFVVNGQQQPENIRAMFFAKYLKGDEGHIEYNKQLSSTSTNIYLW